MTPLKPPLSGIYIGKTFLGKTFRILLYDYATLLTLATLGDRGKMNGFYLCHVAQGGQGK